MEDETHSQSNMFILTIIAHGNKEGHLMDVTGKKGWLIDELVGDVSDGETLTGKPKIFFIQSCRGGKLEGTAEGLVSHHTFASLLLDSLSKMIRTTNVPIGTFDGNLTVICACTKWGEFPSHQVL